MTTHISDSDNAPDEERYERTTSPEDNDAEGGDVSLMEAMYQQMYGSTASRKGREAAIRSLHSDVATELADKRHRRDALEDEIRELVGEEYRLGKMVGMIDRAHKKEQEEGDDA